MKHKIISLIIGFACCLNIEGNAQHMQATIIDSAAEQEKHWTAWLVDLYDMGVVMEKDSIKINKEARRIILDPDFRKIVYPGTYDWQATTALLKNMELKKGLWYLMNLYFADSGNKKNVIEAIVPFGKIVDIEKVLTSTFYTYALLDPKLCDVKTGKPVITRPDIVEKEFNQLKEIIYYVRVYLEKSNT